VFCWGAVLATADSAAAEVKLCSAFGEPMTGMAIRGFAWYQFYHANAKIDGDTIVVWSDQVNKPVAARYAWNPNPAGCNLTNKSGLPAVPFRTDDWEYKK
jgi:sialate O-acetylesterase